MIQTYKNSKYEITVHARYFHGEPFTGVPELGYIDGEPMLSGIWVDWEMNGVRERQYSARQPLAIWGFVPLLYGVKAPCSPKFPYPNGADWLALPTPPGLTDDPFIAEAFYGDELYRVIMDAQPPGVKANVDKFPTA